MLLYQVLAYTIYEKTPYKNNKFKIWAPTWTEEFDLLDGSYSVSDIQDYFEYILKRHSEKNDNLSRRIFVNEIENRIMFKIKQDIISNF